MNVKNTQLYKDAMNDNAKVRRVAGGVVFRIRNGHVQVLLIKRAADDHWPNHWEFPRGGVDDNEDFQDGLKREVFEETGLKVLPLFYLDSFCYAKRVNGRIEQLSIQDNWACKVLESEDNGTVILRPNPEHGKREHDDIQWISFSAQAILATSTSELKNTLVGFLSIPNLKETLENFALHMKGSLNLNKVEMNEPDCDNDPSLPIDEAFMATNYRNLLLEKNDTGYKF